MAKILPKPTIELNMTIAVSESEIRALDALVGYGADSFIDVFYEKLGRAYMEEHEAGLRLLFQSIRSQVPKWLHAVDEAREIFNKKA